MDKWNISYQLKALRKQRGFNQTEIAERLGITQEAFNRIENGNVSLTVKRLFQIAEILDCSISDLLEPGVENEKEILAVREKEEENMNLQIALQRLTDTNVQIANELNELKKMMSFIREIDLIDFEKFQKSAKFPWPPDDIIQTYPIISWMAYYAFVSVMYPDKTKYLSEFYSENKLIRYGKIKKEL
jgi:transcriptional regulator with XRE-family HTH domain